jgi:hypothetical protein
MRTFEPRCYDEAEDEEDWSMSSSEINPVKSNSSKHTGSIECDIASVY